MSISVDIEKKLGSFRLRVKFEAADETLALLGASGCGKSMTLKCIAGIETPDKGRIVLDGVTLFDAEKNINLPPQERHVGLMFQNYALFPNMTVAQNIRAGAKRSKSKAEREQAVRQIIDRFALADLADRYPHQLSGGQQQRVALARIMVSGPRILLLDEPFSALDTHLRFRLEQEVRDAIRSFGKTVLLVSHERNEVYRMADSIAVMNGGRIEVCGEKKAVFAAPGTKTGALLTGCKNISKIDRLSSNRIHAADWGIDLSVNELPEQARYVGIRMHDIRPGEGENSVLCSVEEVIDNPFSVTVILRPDGAKAALPLSWKTEKETWKNLQADTLRISLPPDALLLLKADAEDAE